LPPIDDQDGTGHEADGVVCENAMRSSSDAVCVVPGHSALQRTPLAIVSRATAFVRPITAALLAP